LTDAVNFYGDSSAEQWFDATKPARAHGQGESVKIQKLDALWITTVTHKDKRETRSKDAGSRFLFYMGIKRLSLVNK